MRSIILISVCLLLTSNSFSQEPNPDLFQTWHLTSILASDAKELFIIEDISPTIYPYLIISEDLAFNGEGACNSFTGLYSISPDNVLEVVESESTQNTCNAMVHNDFESDYFGFMGETSFHWYLIEDEGDGQKLRLNNPVFGYAEFSNIQLGTSDFENTQFKIYPNPFSDKLYVNSTIDSIHKIELFTMTGKKVKTVEDASVSIDVSQLKVGLYVLKIFSEKGVTYKKIIKS